MAHKNRELNQTWAELDTQEAVAVIAELLQAELRLALTTTASLEQLTARYDYNPKTIYEMIDRESDGFVDAYNLHEFFKRGSQGKLL